jgi:hypothetical protein
VILSRTSGSSGGNACKRSGSSFRQRFAPSTPTGSQKNVASLTRATSLVCCCHQLRMRKNFRGSLAGEA